MNGTTLARALLAFAVLAVLPARVARAQSSAAATPGLTVVSGPDASPYGVNFHLGSAASANVLAAGGIVWLRCDFNWPIIEPQAGQFDWGPTDAVVAAAVANNQRIYATLAYTPGWANGGQGQSVPPSNPQDWVDFVTAVVSRYKGQVDHWGLWNEPNIGTFWSGSRDQWVNDILIRGADACKAADPSCKVCGPELSDCCSCADWLQAALVGAGDKLDVITQHIYARSAGDVETRLDGSHFFLISWLYPPAIQETLDRYGRGQEVWITETGWSVPGQSESDEAANYASLLGGMCQRDSWTKVFFYDAQDDPNLDYKDGILNADLSPKQCFSAYASFAAAHPDAKSSLSFDPASAFQHQVGRAVPGGFEADAGQDTAGYLLFGPYTTAAMPGLTQSAVFHLVTDSRTPGHEVVATVDVRDATTGQVLATRDVSRGDFHGDTQRFWLGFDATAGDSLELRVYFHGRGKLTALGVEVRDRASR